MVPRSATAMGGTIAVPPWASTALATASESVTLKYTDHTSGVDISGMLTMQPAINSPSLEKLR
jgi:hypothetical protein